MSTSYQPGVCNIDREEQQNRRRIGLIGMAVGILLVLYGYATGSVGQLHRGAIVAAFVTGWTGILQWKMQFCVGFALLGKHSLSEGLSSITDDAAHRADIKQAAKVQGLAVVAGLVTAFLLIAPVTPGV